VAYLAVLGAVFVGLLVWGGYVVVSSFFTAPQSDTRTITVGVASLHSKAEDTLRYPGATVLARRETAGVTTLYPQYNPNYHPSMGRGNNGFEKEPPRILGYSGVPVPATADFLLSIRAPQATVEAWYRRALLHRGWCVQSRDDTTIPSTTVRVVTVRYLRGHEAYEVDLGNSDLVGSLFGQGQPTTLPLTGVPFDPTTVAQVVQTLQAPQPAEPLSVRTEYALYPADGSGLDQSSASCAIN
jgi:hypothetical protein